MRAVPCPACGPCSSRLLGSPAGPIHRCSRARPRRSTRGCRCDRPMNDRPVDGGARRAAGGAGRSGAERAMPLRRRAMARGRAARGERGRSAERRLDCRAGSADRGDRGAQADRDRARRYRRPGGSQLQTQRGMAPNDFAAIAGAAAEVASDRPAAGGAGRRCPQRLGLSSARQPGRRAIAASMT